MTHLIAALDAGHGGRATGAVYGDLVEKDLNLATVRAIDKQLKHRGIRSILTRSVDCAMSFRERAQAACLADLAIVVHYNAGPPSMSGIQCFYDKKWPVGAMVAIQTIISKAPARIRDGGSTRTFRARSDIPRGHRNSFLRRAHCTIRHHSCPALLVECLFLSHPSDRVLLRDPTGIDQIATAITCGIVSYKQTIERAIRDATPRKTQ
jgi:N-acetylmuramoyl-L-alanine amidase